MHIIHFYSILLLLSWIYSPLLGLGYFFGFFILHTVGRTPWTGDQPVATHRATQTQTYMSQAGFERTIPAFERGKTVHALDRAAAVIGIVTV
jgi:hypothetical protein